MLKNYVKWVAVVGLSFTLASSSANAANYVQPNQSYDDYSVPSYRNTVPVDKPIWRVNIGRPDERFEYDGNRVTTSERNVYFLKSGRLVATNAKTGKAAWTYGQKLQQPIAFDEGDIFVFDANGKLYQVNAKTGKAGWITSYIGKQVYISGLAFDKQTVYVGYNSGLLAIDRKTGKVNWSNNMILNSGIIINDNQLLASTVESGAITVSVTYAVNKITGKTLWRAGSIPSPLFIKNGLLYSRYTWPHSDSDTHQFQLSIVNLATGKTNENLQYIPIPEGKDPLYYQAHAAKTDGESLFIQSAGAEKVIYRYDYQMSGDEQQPVTYEYTGNWIAGPYNNKLFFENENGKGIQALKVVNKQRVYYEGLNNPVSRLDFFHRGMFVGQTDGEIYVLDVTTGKALFRFQTSARNFEPFHVVNGVLLVQAEDMLYAFQLPKQLLQPL